MLLEGSDLHAGLSFVAVEESTAIHPEKWVSGSTGQLRRPERTDFLSSSRPGTARLVPQAAARACALEPRVVVGLAGGLREPPTFSFCGKSES